MPYGNNDIRKLALNQENMQGMDTHFSIKVESKGITDQKSVWPLRGCLPGAEV